jgi:hypothetical protein
MFERVALLETEHDRSWPQLTLETEDVVTVNVNVVGVVAAPRGLPVTCTWREPGGVVEDV